jgi:hypothetical protein
MTKQLVGELTVQNGVVVLDFVPDDTTGKLYQTGGVLYWGNAPISAGGTKAANSVYAGPAAGAAAVPTFRALVAADLPDLSLVYQAASPVLTAFGALADAVGWLSNNGVGGLAWNAPSPLAIGAEADLGVPGTEGAALVSTVAGVRSWSAKEPALGAPAADGYILSSTMAGVRSWIAAPNSAVWGHITGTLSDQTDLGLAIAAREPALGNPGVTGYVLSSTSGGARSWIAPTSAPVGANPSANVSNSVVNGSAGTFLRSDAAPAISTTAELQIGQLGLGIAHAWNHVLSIQKTGGDAVGIGDIAGGGPLVTFSFDLNTVKVASRNNYPLAFLIDNVGLTEVARFSPALNLLIGTVSDTGLTGAGGLSVASATEAASSTTGAVITAGGLGVAKKLYVGTDLHALGVFYAGSSPTTLTDAAGKILSAALNTVAIGQGGTGQTTKVGAFDALSPLSALGDLLYGGASGTGTTLPGNATTTRKFLRQTGASGGVSAAPAWDTVTAGDVGATTVGGNLLALVNPSAISFIRLNADNTVTALSAVNFCTAIGAGTSSFDGTWGSLSGKPANVVSFGALANAAGWLHNDGAGAFTYTAPGISDVFPAQAANAVFAGPATGANAAPTFRALVAADLGTTLAPQFARLGLGVAADTVFPLKLVGAANPTSGAGIVVNDSLSSFTSYPIVQACATTVTTMANAQSVAGILSALSFNLGATTTGNVNHLFLETELAAAATYGLSAMTGIYNSVQNYSNLPLTGVMTGLSTAVRNYGSGTVASVTGGIVTAYHFGAGTATQVMGLTINSGLRNNASQVGTITTATGNQLNMANASVNGTIGTSYGVNVTFTNAGTRTTAYGLYVTGLGTGGTWTNTPYDLYMADAGAFNYFAGPTAMGGATPDARRALVVNGNLRVSDQSQMVAAMGISGFTSTVCRIMFHAENATAWTPTLSTDQTLIGVYSSPRISADTTTNSAVYGIEITPQIVSSSAGARLTLDGSTTWLLRTQAADLSSNANNAIVGSTVVVGHYLAQASVVTGTVGCHSTGLWCYGGSMTLAYGFDFRAVVGSNSGPANSVIGTLYGLRLEATGFANGGSITTEWGISQESTTAKNQFLGKTGIGAAPTATSSLHLGGVPTSAAGLAAGDVWSNGGVLTIV